MPWSRSVEEGEHVVIARLAHYLHQYADTRRSELKAIVSKSTLTRYCNYRAVLDHNNPRAKEFGPRRLDVFFNLTRTLGHNPSTVLYAAMVSRSPEEMAYIISQSGRDEDDASLQPILLKRSARPVRIRRPIAAA